LREYPDKEPREQLFRMYEDILINQSTPWVEINGGYEERLESAIRAIDTIL
jgi:nicotinamide riboside kinase